MKPGLLLLPVLLLSVVMAFVAPGLALAQAGSLDSPVKKQVQEFGPSPHFQSGKITITLHCYFYTNFMVKMYDEGQKGAEWLAIVPVKGRLAPSCTKIHATDEKVIIYPEWSGYFKGAKGRFVIFNASDGTDGGMPFVIYDSITGKQLFQDSYFESSMWNRRFPDSPFNDMRITIAPHGQPILRYLRVAAAGCDLHLEKAACWPEVMDKFALKSTSAPVCSGYKRITTRYESELAYPVEVSLFPQPAINTIAGPVRCWPVD